jgi:hypothetical protein
MGFAWLSTLSMDSIWLARPVDQVPARGHAGGLRVAGEANAGQTAEKGKCP